MLTVAYLANLFPAEVEHYVQDEIVELRRRGVRVVTGSVRRVREEGDLQAADILLQSLRLGVIAAALWLCVAKCKLLLPVIVRALFSRRPWQGAKALAHTFLGACYAVGLNGYDVDHIHAHHGYFGSWVAMTAAKLLDTGFSMTLHGSDLLQHGVFLDVKLQNCAFCFTVSEYNRRYIIEHFPEIDPEKVIVARLGVDASQSAVSRVFDSNAQVKLFQLLAVGRLHVVKDHAFLIRACARLRQRGISFACTIAGDGPERRHLESLIQTLGLADCITLLGHVPRQQIDSLYARADVVVLTSRSEGIPLVLMEAMARGKLVLAPAITGIPELVIAGETGFLYQPGSEDDFVERLLEIYASAGARRVSLAERQKVSSSPRLAWVRHAAQTYVRHNFNRNTNLEYFAEVFLTRIASRSESVPDENSVLQQIQLSVQRNRSLPV
jgi:colanic acid/amylovoran biosynthesis glycosyltransferase